ncbi:FMN-dependent NADH-azoreductase [Stackebrandtia soli]|uniref:FMN-dependent NADH-azoreductase n=1 Tax=Stackebrandtia soli TaxID=1892856 RepID=UPI0039EB730B
MSTLLHIDSSLNGERSHSRATTAAFAEQWRASNPTGTYVYRDVAADPIPHFDVAGHTAANTTEADHTPEQAAAWRITKPLIDEVSAADVILLGAPMYNFTIPTTLKAWLDRLAVPAFSPDADGRSALSGKRFIVATSRGGSYAPGTPRASSDHQEPLLRTHLGFLGVDENLKFIHTEMTLSLVVPALAEFKHVFEETRNAARATARELATVS